MNKSVSAHTRWLPLVPDLASLVLAYSGALLILVAPTVWRTVLVLQYAILLACAAWLSRMLFARIAVPAPFLAGAAVTAGVWAWQWMAFFTFFPAGDVPYGYFLEPVGAQAHRWVLHLPFWVGTILLGLAGVWAFASCYRKGLGLKALWVVPWWLAWFFVFSLPSAFLDGQGNASIVI